MQIFYKLVKKFSLLPFSFATCILGLVAHSVFNGELTSLEMPPSLNTSAVGDFDVWQRPNLCDYS